MSALAPIPVDPLIGQRYGPYQIIGHIAQGGLGTVYAAQHTILYTYAAIKLLRPDRGYTPSMRERFLREARIVFQLQHPHIVQANDAGEQNGDYFLVMELLTGGDLTRVLTTYTFGLNIADACEVVYQATQGLAHIHSRELIHRDIKPSNLYLTMSGVTKLLDLGLARSVNSLEDVRLTITGQVMGTPDFMAPEQCESTHHVDIRADLYSMGATFYALLAGRPPFFGEGFTSHVKKMHGHMEVAPPDIKLRRPELPDELVAVVNRLLEKRPEDRFQTPAELLTVLEPFRDGADLQHLVNNLPGQQSTLDLPRLQPLADSPRTPLVTPPPPVLKTLHRSHVTPSNVLIALALSLFLGGAIWLGINGSNTLGIRPVMAPSTPVTIVDDQSGEGVQPVEPKQNVEDGRDGRPDFWAKDIDHELLRYKPLPIRWADPVHKDCDLTFDPEKRRLVVQVFSSAIFELAEVNEPNFDYHVQINSSNWKTTRNSGIAFGIKRTNNVNDTVFAQVNLIVGNYLPPDFNNNRPNAAWFLNRMSGVVKTKLDFAGFHDWGSTMTFCNTDIPSPIANGMKIKISVRNRLLTSVQYNGQVFDGFLNLKNEERLLNPDATGGIGVVTFGNAIFTNAILRVLK